MADLGILNAFVGIVTVDFLVALFPQDNGLAEKGLDNGRSPQIRRSYLSNNVLF